MEPSVNPENAVPATNVPPESRIALQLPMKYSDGVHSTLVCKKAIHYDQSSYSDSQPENKENRETSGTGDVRSVEYGKETDPNNSPKHLVFTDQSHPKISPVEGCVGCRETHGAVSV